MTPTFILGVPRSGTTLLRVLLDSHSCIAGAPETAWITGGYGERSVRELVEYLGDSELGPVQNLSGVSAASITRAARRFLESIFADYLEARNKRYLVLKTPDDIRYLEFLLAVFPDANFIHIHRDGRDVACSTAAQKGKFFGTELSNYGELTVLSALQRWHDWDAGVRQIFAGRRYSYLNISYEDLVSEPESVLSTISAFIGLGFEPGMLDYARREHEYPSWEAGSTDVRRKAGVDVASVGRWQQEWPLTSRAEIDALHGDYLESLGYPRCKAVATGTAGARSNGPDVCGANAPRVDQALTGGVNLKNQVDAYFGDHRSGWAFAVQALSPLHDPAAIYLNTFVEKTFVWDPRSAEAIEEPWIGIIHIPPGVPDWFMGHQSNDSLFAGAAWERSLPHCRGLFTLSEYHRRHLQQRLDVPIGALLHPTETPSLTWSPEAFRSNPNKSIIQIGWWLRVLHAIFELPYSGLDKIFLRARNEPFLEELMRTERELRRAQGLFSDAMYDTARIVDHLAADDYDRLLSENIVFLNLYDASANNTIVECIVRGTPILVNPLEAVTEYLGDDYPLYYDTLDEAAEKAGDPSLLYAAHDYLKALPIREKLTGDYFRRSILGSDIVTSSQQRPLPGPIEAVRTVTPENRAEPGKPDALSARALCDQGETCFEQGDVAGAEQKFQQALVIDPCLADGYNNLGVVWWGRGEAKIALEYFSKGLGLDPDHRDLILNTAAVLAELGKRGDAEELYSHYLVSHADDEEVRERLQAFSSTPSAGPKAIVQPVDFSSSGNRSRAPRISVIIPSYNQGQFLETTLRSVLDQNYPNLELIVMDGGSTDCSVEIIKRYNDRIDYWQSQPDDGQYWAVDEGLRRSSGEIMTWINSDDKLHVNSLHIMASIFSQRADVDWVTGTPNIMNQDGFITWIAHPTPVFSHRNYLDKRYDFPSFIQQEGTFWRRDLWDKAGATLQTDLKMAGDLELWARFFRYAPLHTASVCTGCFRQQGNQKTAKAMDLYHAEAVKVLDRELALFATSGHKPIAAVDPVVVHTGTRVTAGNIGVGKALGPVFPLAQPDIRTSSTIPGSRGHTQKSDAMHRARTEPLVSAIVSTYNSEKYLRGCLEDLEAQTLASRLEIIVIDSGSEQREGDIVAEFQRRHANIRYLRTKSRETIYSAWNRAIAMARGRYITNANTDDRHRVDAFECMVKVLEADREAVLCYADAAITTEKNSEFATAPVTGWFRWPEFDARLLFAVCYIGPQPMWRRDLHDRYGYFDPRLRVAGDYDFWLRVAVHERFRHLPEVLGLYLSADDSIEHALADIGARESGQVRERNWPAAWGERPPLSPGYLVTANDNEGVSDRDDINQPLVSVIIATRNRRELLPGALQSVQRQSYPHWEIIVINDGGEDVADVIARLGTDARVQYLQNPQSMGQAAARNRALQAASGDIVTFLDDDDLYLSDHLQVVVKALRSTKFPFVYTDADLVQETVRGGVRREISRSAAYRHGAWSRERLFVDNYIPINTWAFRKNCLDQTGGFDETLICCEDWELLLRMARHFTFQHIAKTTVEVRHRVDRVDNVTRQRLGETEAVYTLIYNRYNDYGDVVRDDRERALENLRGKLDALEPEAPAPMTPAADGDAETEDENQLVMARDRFITRVSERNYHCPAIHLIVVVDPTRLVEFGATLDALGRQFYAGWGLSVVSTVAAPAGVLDELPMIEWLQTTDVGGCLWQAVQDSRGEWVAIVEAGDRLHPHALSSVVDYSNNHPDWRFIYVDECVTGMDGSQVDVFYKPDINVDYLLTRPYLGRFCLVRRDTLAVETTSFFHVETINLDLCLRILDRHGEQAIGHIADVLSQRSPMKCVPGDAAPLATGYTAAITAHLQRSGVDARLNAGVAPDTFMVEYPLTGQPTVCLVLYAVDRLEAALLTIGSVLERTAHQEYRLRVAVGTTGAESFSVLRDDRLQIDLVADTQTRTTYLNAVAQEEGSDYLLVLDPGAQVVQEGWLRRLLTLGLRQEVGAVGVRLVSPDRSVVHGGIVTGAGPFAIGGIAFEGLEMTEPGYMQRAQVPQSVSAVSSACMLVRTEVFLQAGGFDAGLDVPVFQDVDLCQRILGCGRKIVWTPFVTLLYTGVELGSYSGTKGLARVQADALAVSSRWLSKLAKDPAYNRNLSLKRVEFRVDGSLPPAWNPVIDELPGFIGFGSGSPGSWQYRVVQPLASLKACGAANCVQTPFIGRTRIPLPTAAEIERLQPRALLMHNTLHDDCIEALETYKRVNGVFIVFGQDDLMFALPPKNPFSRTVYKDIKKRIRHCLRLADRLVVTTEALASGLRNMVDDICVVPNYLDDRVWSSLESKRNVARKPRAGWAGAQQHLGDLEMMEQVVKQTAGDVDWVFFGMCPECLRPYVKEVHDAVRFEQYPAQLAALNLDIAIAPLEHNRFNEAKSNLRILEYGVLGWPVIASDIEPYKDAPVCLVKNQPRAWINAIRERARDMDALRKEGDELRGWVRGHWMLSQHSADWLVALDSSSGNAAPGVVGHLAAGVR